MITKYKKSYIVINVILSVVLLFLISDFIIIKKTSYLFLIISIFIPTFVLVHVYGYETKRRRFTFELIFYVFAYSIIFLILTYIHGLFVEFTRNVYKLNLDNLIHNIIPFFILIVISEILRYQISRKGEGSNLSYLLVTLILILVDMILFRDRYPLSTGDGQIKYICSIVIPSIFKNAVLLYFTKKGGIHPSLLYRLLFDLSLVIFPIFPSFGLYFESIIYTILPVLMMFIIHINLKQFIVREEKEVDIRKTLLYKYLIFIMLLSVVVTVNILTSGYFKYTMVSIGSGSMSPKINKGDTVVYKKLSKDNIPVEGQVIAFKKQKKLVVHRVITRIDINENERIYYTQGDANEKPDGYPIEEKNILGTVEFRIKYIGIPSVVLGELLAQ